MTLHNFNEEVQKRREEIIAVTQHFLQIKSVYDPATISGEAPFGQGISKALNFLLDLGKEDKFLVKNVNGYAGYIETGAGSEMVGVLCHVDVVPPGEGWTTSPFSADIRDDKIYARGAIDDKGPTIAAYYAMKIVSELDAPFTKRVRLILGTDEERDWNCVEHYFSKEEKPTLGFAPDADFPIIHAEKGIYDLVFRLDNEMVEKEMNHSLRLVSFQSGERLNMVPDKCQALIDGTDEVEFLQMENEFIDYLQEHKIIGNSERKGNQVTFNVKGVAAHGMEPNNGVNAGILLGHFLARYSFAGNDQRFLQFISTCLYEASRGENLGIANEDEVSGPLTINPGTFLYHSTKGEIGCTIRYPVTQTVQVIKDSLKESIVNTGFTSETIHDSPPHYVEENSQLIQTLQRVYERQTGDKANLIAIGGGTYARALPEGVAFGPLFPGREDVAHQKDEYISIDDLLKATAIYAEAIYELATS
ncbi:dipeptidase PepV [Bacillus alkalicellulosilyticus]|uniref:dipeptidase PepV n=1 Tax=Alkalihalobacterium alkalicellulosilyticum TaxID=1912214 RepID=UPI0009972764|nr:dipeptidase PepV [Bacillus alkalicellulosilyticus]